MKLRLPQILLTALMAVMSALPTYAATTLKTGDGPAKPWDGVLEGTTKYWIEGENQCEIRHEGEVVRTESVPYIRYFDTLDEDVEITVDGVPSVP